jgi:hypothetical protein
MRTHAKRSRRIWRNVLLCTLAAGSACLDFGDFVPPLNADEQKAVGVYDLVSLNDSTVPGPIELHGPCDWLTSTFRADEVLDGQLTLAADRRVEVSHRYRGKKAIAYDSTGFVPTYSDADTVIACAGAFPPTRWKIENGTLLFQEPGFLFSPTDWKAPEVSNTQYPPGTRLTYEEAIYAKR